MDGADPDPWSAVAAEWSELWGDLVRPVWQIVATATGVGPGSRVLDVGCGTGEFLQEVRRLGAAATGIDPAPGMIDVARSRLPDVDLRVGSADNLPWLDDTFDLVTAFNSFQFVTEPRQALAEFRRVLVPGGHIGIVSWAEAEANDVHVIEAAVAAATGRTLPPDDELRQPGGLLAVLVDAGLEVVAAGLIRVPWAAADEEMLLRAILLGEEPADAASVASVVIATARPFRTDIGGYRLDNAFRYAVARTPV